MPLSVAKVLILFYLAMSQSTVVSLLSPVRIELFFKDPQQLKDRVTFLCAAGVSRYNLVNKDASDDLLGQITAVRAVQPEADICVHYSLPHQRVKRSSVTDHLAKLRGFLKDTADCRVLIVSGSRPVRDWTTVEALERLQQEGIPENSVGVAFNPYFSDTEEQRLEWERLQAKIATGLVDNVNLQFGSDLDLLRQALERLQTLPVAVTGSVFLPTAQLLAQQKFRPWKGVFLSDYFVSGPDAARETVVKILRLYRKFNVQVLVEAPGIRTAKDLELLTALLQERDEDIPEKRASPDPTQMGSSGSQQLRQDDISSIQSSKRLKLDFAPKVSPATPPPNGSSPAIVLFGSHDVRLADNGALEQALEQHSCILPVFLWEPNQPQWGVRGALQVVLKDALRNLVKSLDEYSLPLVCRNTEDCVQELRQLVQETGADTVYWNRDMTPEGRALDARRTRALSKLGVKTGPCQSSLLYDVEQLDLATGFQGGHWGTLMPFLRACEKQLGDPPRSVASGETKDKLPTVVCPSFVPSGVSVADLQMAVMPSKAPWDGPILERFTMTEQAAQERLDYFFEKGLGVYEKDRSRADLDYATSQLSVHLRVGTLSPRDLYWRTKDSPLSKDDKKTFWRRLFWRDLSYLQLLNFPQMRDRSIREHYEDVEWVTGDEARERLSAWKKGRTGYPIVDAGMRELYSTGWMTQPVRMVVASFLTEYLRVNWVKGAEWFHDTLVDADSAINPMMWQNAGRSGIDQWNFVMSPEAASQDASGDYTRKWVPELAKLPKKLLHRPWKASKEELVQAGVVLGSTYPNRIVDDLKAEQVKTVESVLHLRRESQDKNDAKGYDIVTLPDGQETVVFTRKCYRIDRQGIVMEPTKSGASKSAPKSSGRGRRGRRGR